MASDLVTSLKSLAIADFSAAEPARSADQEPAEPASPLSLGELLVQIDIWAVQTFLVKLSELRCIGLLRLTCRVLRDFADAHVFPRKPLAVQLREDDNATEPLAALERFLGEFELDVRLPLTAPAGVDALLPAAFTALPEHVRRRVTAFMVGRSGRFVPGRISGPTVSGAAVGGLAASLPCLRTLSLVCLPWTWSPGDQGETYAALAALGTLEELVVPGLAGLTGLGALAGSLRRLWVLDDNRQPRQLSAVATLSQLTGLEELRLHVKLEGRGAVPDLLRLLPPSLKTLSLQQPGITLGLRDKHLTAISIRARLSVCWDEPSSAALSALAQQLLPCLEPGAKLESLSVEELRLGWGGVDLDPLSELLRRSDSINVGRLCAYACFPVGVASALAELRNVGTLAFTSHSLFVLDLQLQPPAPSSGSCPDLPSPEEVLRMALQRLASPGGGAEGGAVAGGPAVAAGDGFQFVLLVRGPAVAAMFQQPIHEQRIWAWAEDLRSEVIGRRGPLGTRIIKVLPLPPASAVLVECGSQSGGGAAAEAVAAAMSAAWEGSEAVRVRWPSLVSFHDDFKRVVMQVAGELWAASAGEGGPSLLQRVEWAMKLVTLYESFITY